jgi:hypothetical protein
MFEDALAILALGEEVDPAELKQYILEGLLKRTPEGFKLTPEGAKLLKNTQSDLGKPKPEKPKPENKPVPEDGKPKPETKPKPKPAAKAMELTFTPPPAVRRAARLALDIRSRMPRSGRGMTMIGVARARDLSNGRPVSVDTLRRMLSYFARHEVDKQGGSWRTRGKGWQAWHGWGGDAGRIWARRMLQRIDGENEGD